MTDTNLRKIYEAVRSGNINKPVKKVIPKQVSLPQLALEKYIVQYKRPEESAFQELHVSDDQFKKAIRFLKVNEDSITTAIARLNSFGLREVFAKQILSYVMAHDYPEKFFSAINNRLPLNEFLASDNFVQLLSKKFGLDTELTNILLNYQPATQPTTGRGETAVILFVDGAHKGSVGDVEVSSGRHTIKLEVKSGAGRLTGHSGYGSIAAVANHFKHGLLNLFKKTKFGKDKGINDRINNIKLGEFNFGKGLNGVIDREFTPTLINNGITRQDIVKLYTDGFSIFFNKENRKDIEQWISDGLSREGYITDKFKENYFNFNASCYAKSEEFNYLVFIVTADTRISNNQLGKIQYISKDDILDGKMSSKFEAKAFPTFAGRAGRDDVFAFGPK